MSTPQQTKKASFHLRRWILGVSTLMMLSVAVASVYRESIIIKVSNNLAKNYGIKVEQLTGLVMKFDLKQPWFIDSIALANVDLSLDYLQFQQATQAQTVDTDSKTTATALVIPTLPDWIPDLHITNITVRGDNLPDFAADKLESWSSLKLNTLDVKNIVYRYNNVDPEFGFSVWQQELQLLTAEFNYSAGQLNDKSNDRDRHKQLNGTLITDLAKTKPIMDLFLPELNGLLSGSVKVDIALNPEKVDRIAVAISLNDVGLYEQQQAVITNTNLTLTTALTLGDNGWLADAADLNLVNVDPITVSADNCALFDSLFKMANAVCQPFQQSDSLTLTPIIITPQLPLSLQLSIQDRNIDTWQVAAKQLGATVHMSENRFALQVNQLLLTPGSWQGSWAISAAGNSRFFSAVDGLEPMPVQVAGKGVVEFNPTSTALQTKLLVNQASITAQQFKYTDMSSDNMTVKLLTPTRINIKDNKVSSFTSAFETILDNSQYQQTYKINTLTAQHKASFSTKSIVLNSDWQLDDALLKSENTVSLLELKPIKAEGYWQLPIQNIPSLMTDVYPLPKGLTLSAQITNKLNYTLNLATQKPYLAANISGELTADSAHFNDISAAQLKTSWRCNMDSTNADISASLMAKCTIDSNVAAVNMGPVVENIAVSGLVSLTNGQFQVAVDNASADIFSGQVSVLPLLITDFEHIVGQIQVRNLSLPEAVELYQVPGVKVTGLLKADLPFVLQGSAVSITDGVIEGQGQGGIIQIKDNVTIDQLKLTQPQLRYALDLLENLHYERLYSAVDFKPSGETKLLISIKGRNPSVERPIEFNYSHEENILQLFRSLRINDSMYDALDKMNNP
ncbi:intermembrane phospholipid transport protein YdbH family protein [Moritella dasanensis]|uniref:intermembrane phospholipid transport protein YdbH family protein n=1 Tax=Moritella dasanensis TaxID=428031 RepID=UPI000309AEED|nr:YdbH domain-containing protein [Moritella dasanensis]